MFIKIKNILNKINNSIFIKKYNDDHIDLYACQSTLYFIISAVPFLAILLSLVQYLLPYSQEEFLQVLNTLLPTSLQFWSNLISSIVYTSRSISFTSIAAITTLWGASKSCNSLSIALVDIYETEDKQNKIISRLLSVVYTLIFIISMILLLAFVVYSKQLISIIDKYIPLDLYWLNNVFKISELISLIIITIIFTLMYKVLSHSEIKIYKNLPGALFSSLSWLLFSWIYSFIVNNISNMSITYGSLANIVMMIIWLLSCIKIFLFGAELNIYLEKYKKWEK